MRVESKLAIVSLQSIWKYMCMKLKIIMEMKQKIDSPMYNSIVSRLNAFFKTSNCRRPSSRRNVFFGPPGAFLQTTWTVSVRKDVRSNTQVIYSVFECQGTPGGHTLALKKSIPYDMMSALEYKEQHSFIIVLQMNTDNSNFSEK